MTARFASCSYESVETLKQLKEEVEQEKLGYQLQDDRLFVDSFLRKEQKELFRRFEDIRFKVNVTDNAEIN